MVPGATSHCPRQAPVMPLVLVFTDVDTLVVHCQRHIHVYHFVYLRPTQGAHEFSIWITLRGRGRLLSLVMITVSGEIQVRLISKL